jgi:myo-inositol-1(or 4)-monophosphatase
LSDIDLERVREVGTGAARLAGGILKSRIDSIREVRHKGVVDLVTDVDLQSEREVCNTLLSAFPVHSILAEEGGARAGDPRYRWIIDPLDGTTNYAHGFPLFCAPAQDELFVAEAGKGATLNGRPLRVSQTTELRQAMLATGFPYDRAELPRALRSFEVLSWQSQAVRRVGSAALDLCYVASGRFDGYWEHQVNAWDMAAGALIVTEAGGTLSGTDGSAFSVDGGQVLASNGRLHSALTDALAGI